MEGNKIVKEEFKLLDLSGSDSDWDFQEIPTNHATRKKKLKRRHKKPITSANIQPVWCPSCPKNALWVLFIVFILCTITGLIWFSVNMHQRLNLLAGKFQKVEIENENLPAELHGYHSSLQDIIKNQTQFKDDLVNLSNKIEMLGDQIQKVFEQLKTVESKAAKGPQLVSLQTLQDSVGKFGSQLTDLNSNMPDIKSNLEKLNNQQKAMDNELELLKANMNSTMNNFITLSNNCNETTIEVHRHHNSISDLSNKLEFVGSNLNITMSRLDQIFKNSTP